MQGGSQVNLVFAQRDIEKSVKNLQKGTSQRQNQEKEQETPRKEKVEPNSKILSQQGSTGPSMSGVGGSKQQIVIPRALVATTNPEVDLRYVFQETIANVENSVSPIGLEGEAFENSPRKRPSKL